MNLASNGPPIDEKDKDTDEVAVFEGRSKFVTMKRQTDSLPEGSTKQTNPHVPVAQQQQQSVDQTMLHLYSSVSSGTGWTHSQQTQVVTSWDPPYSYAASQSALEVPLSLTQHSSVTQIRAQGREWLVNTSDPYQSTNLPGLSTHPDSQAYTHMQCYDQLPNDPPLASSIIPTSYFDLGSIHAHHHQNSLPSQTQHYDQPPNVLPLASSTAPTSSYELGSVHAHHHQNSLPSVHQYHEPMQQLPPIALAPPELAQLGLVAQESRLDQQWTSFMRESGCFEDFGYTS